MDIKSQKGYTLLFAMVVSSIALSVAAFILSISRKEFILSSTAKNSIISIYAADGGVQCAVEGFRQTPNQLASSSATTLSSCGNATITQSTFGPIDSVDSGMGMLDQSSQYYSSSYQIYQTKTPINIKFNNGTCALVTVTYGYYGDSSSGYNPKVVIDSRGYNISSSGPCAGNTPNSREVERAMRLQYNQ